MQTWQDMKEHGNIYRLIGNPEYQLEQYTGLKDKNGTKIFEGDIVSIYDKYNKVWTVDGAPIVFKNAYVGGWVIKDNNSDKHASLGARNLSRIKVIGNIHENKE